MRKITFSIALLLSLGASAQIKNAFPADLRLRCQRLTTAGQESVLKQARIQGVASTQRAVGYCDGDSITTRSIYLGTPGTMPVAACANSSLLSNYVGCKIVGIRFALSQTIGKTNVFMYRLEDGAMTDTIVTQSIRRTSDGWNNVFFNSGKEYTIKGGESFLFGFNYNESQEMADNGNGALCAYSPTQQNSNAFLALGNFGSGYGWYDLSSMGNVCIQLIVDVSNKPKLDLKLSNLLIGSYYKKPGDSVNYFIQYENTGLEAIDSCKLAYQIDDWEPVLVNCPKALAESSSDSKDAYITIPANVSDASPSDLIGKHNFRFYVTEINGKVPEHADTITQPFVIYTKAFARQKHYVEQYNSQRSYYSSLVNTRMNTYAKNATNVCLVNIYESESALTKPETQYLFDLYAYTYPCFTIDRFYYFGEKYTAFDVNDYISVYPSILEESMQMLVGEADSNPAFGTVNINGSLSTDLDSSQQSQASGNTTSRLNVTVQGEIAPEAKSVFGDLALTVILTEDSVMSSQVVLNSITQTTSTNKKYIHQAVFRQYLSSPLGDATTTGDGSSDETNEKSTYSKSYSIELPSSYDVNHLNIIAFLTQKADTVSAATLREMDITNAKSCKVISLTAPEIDGIRETTQDSSINNKSQFTYNIFGQRVSKNTKGIIISNGHKFIK